MVAFYGTCNISVHKKPIINIIILVIVFMQGIYNYIPETTHVSTVHSVAAVLYLQSVLHVMLFLPRDIYVLYAYISTSHSMCVHCPIYGCLFVVP